MQAPDEAALKFIEQQIDTVPHMEALLLLWENRPRAFTAAELAQRIFVTEATATHICKDLTQKKLASADHGAGAYAYDPAWDANGDLMPRVAATYRRDLIRVTTLIHSKASPGVREFARAFEPKKE
jgi:hypothetical protein